MADSGSKIRNGIITTQKIRLTLKQNKILKNSVWSQIIVQ